MDPITLILLIILLLVIVGGSGGIYLGALSDARLQGLVGVLVLVLLVVVIVRAMPRR